jgi:hypothetical protein
MVKKTKTDKPIVMGFELIEHEGLGSYVDALRWELHGWGIKDDGREDNPWRLLDGAGRLLAADKTEEAAILIAIVTEKIAEHKSTARANAARSHKRGVLKREVVALWHGQSNFRSVRSFAHWLARERKAINPELSEVKQKKQLDAYTQKIRRYLQQTPKP